jgi:putative addiction module component (TIGR02574 family)
MIREVILKVPEERYRFVMELIDNLGLEVGSDMEIPEWQKNIVRERMAEYKANPSIAIPWDDVKDSFDLDAK